MTGCGQSNDASCVEPATGPPEDVFCTGLYLDRDPTHHAKDVIPYQPGVTFWSDGAEKQRYFYLPAGAKIDTSNMDRWSFPAGTKAWKEFRLGGKLVETRLFWKRSASIWEHATYIWDAAGKSAVLSTSKMPTLLESGYEIPSAVKVCDKCHGGAADELLGIEPVSLALASAQGLTLTGLVSSGALSRPPQVASITLPDDGTGKAAAALGYLHMNCGACHSARGISGFTQLHTRLRADQVWAADGSANALTVAATDAYATGMNQDVLLPKYVQAYPGTKIITPGSHDKSLVWQLAHYRGLGQMPPIVSHKVDEVGTQKLADWIDAVAK